MTLRARLPECREPETGQSNAEARDAAVRRDVDEMLADHRVFGDLQIEATVRGGVAHVRGTLSRADEREALRAAVARVRGVHAVWDVLRIEGGSPLKILDIGCGATKQQEGAIGVDLRPGPGVDVVCDLEQGLPFPEDDVDHVYAVHFLEHVRDLIGLMNEIHRVLKPDGVLHVLVPHHLSVNAVADPTHVRYFHPKTFKYFCVDSPGAAPFRPLSVSTSGQDVFADLRPVKQARALPCAQELARFFD